MGRNLAKVGNNAKYPARSPLDGFPTGFTTAGADGPAGDDVATADPTSQDLPEVESADGPVALDLGDTRGI